jgi:hypothetical protein
VWLIRVRTYADVMREQQLNREREQTIRNIQDKKKEEAELLASEIDRPTKASGLAPPTAAPAAPTSGQKRRNRWDQSTDLYVDSPFLKIIKEYKSTHTHAHAHTLTITNTHALSLSLSLSLSLCLSLNHRHRCTQNSLEQI